jgi:hypothetical protein
MSTTHLVYDTGTIYVQPGRAHQIGPNLDVRKYSKIRVIAHDFSPKPPEPILVDLLVKEGSIELPLLLDIALPFAAGPLDVVLDVPGRELQIWVKEFKWETPRKLQMFVFGLEL